MNRRSSRLWTMTVIVLAFAVPAAAEDWPQFRGSHRNGHSPETGLLDSWPEGGPREVWRHPIGEGYSEITVVGDRLYTMFNGGEGEDKLEYAAALDAATGEEIWRTEVGKNLDTEFGNGPRATPVIAGGTVYVLGSLGDFAALSAADGAKKWSVQLTEAFGSKRPSWGFSASALVDGDIVLVEGGGAEGKAYAGFDKATGEVRWTVGDAPGVGYNSPLAIDVDGDRRFVMIGGGVVRSIDTSGNELWSHPFTPGESHSMPIFIPPDRYFASGVGGDTEGSLMVRVEGNGDGVSVEELWQTRGMKNHFSSSLHHDGYIYGFDNSTFKCISAETGEQAWAKRRLGKGSLIFADGDLVVLSDRGRLVLVPASSESYQENGSVQALAGKCWTAPALSGGKVYLRNHTEMVAYDLEG